MSIITVSKMSKMILLFFVVPLRGMMIWKIDRGRERTR